MKHFEGRAFTCLLCGSIMRSQYQGHFSTCECNESFVDETNYYVRFGGSVNPTSLDEQIFLDFVRISKLEGNFNDGVDSSK